MNWLIWIQLIEGALFAAILGSFAAGYIADVYRQWRWDWKRETRAAIRKSVGDDLYDACHWFGESREAFEVLKLVALKLQEGDGISAPPLRDEWRRKLEPSKEHTEK